MNRKIERAIKHIILRYLWDCRKELDSKLYAQFLESFRIVERDYKVYLLWQKANEQKENEIDLAEWKFYERGDTNTSSFNRNVTIKRETGLRLLRELEEELKAERKFSRDVMLNKIRVRYLMNILCAFISSSLFAYIYDLYLLETAMLFISISLLGSVNVHVALLGTIALVILGIEHGIFWLVVAGSIVIVQKGMILIHKKNRIIVSIWVLLSGFLIVLSLLNVSCLFDRLPGFIELAICLAAYVMILYYMFNSASSLNNPVYLIAPLGLYIDGLSRESYVVLGMLFLFVVAKHLKGHINSHKYGERA